MPPRGRSIDLAGICALAQVWLRGTQTADSVNWFKVADLIRQTDRVEGAPILGVRMTVQWFVPLGQTRSIASALNSLMTDIRTTRGCIGCSVSTGLADQGSVRYVEEWRSEDDLRRRLASHEFRSLAALIDDAMEPPRVEFTLPGGTRGLDFLEEVHHSAGR